MNKLHIRDLVIEITRRCNMNCLHCLRGEPENKVIDIKHIDKLFSKLDSIDTLTITGGEPSLHPEIIDQIVELAKKHNITIETFYMVTNAKKVTGEFLKAVINLYTHCNDVDPENNGGGLSISGDGYHEELNKENVKKLQAFSFTSIRNESGGTYDEYLVNEGRSIDNYCTTKDITFDQFNIYDDVIESDGNALIYLNCLGDLLGGCDLSYETQRNNNLIIANVHDKYFNLKQAVQRYNKMLESVPEDERTIDGISCMKKVA